MDKKVALIILDGFGYAPNAKKNAIVSANTPYIDALFKENSFALLKDYGKCVGLPEFQTGGSEVGHITIGAGREVLHLLTLINNEIESGRFAQNPQLRTVFSTAKKNNRIHLMGMISDGGIHSFQPHLYGLLEMATAEGIENIFIHCFTDGRDVGERTAKQYLSEIEEKNIGKISTLGGRFFAMDRDDNFERTQQMYDAMCDVSQDIERLKPLEYIEKFYQNSDKSDYYIPPVCFDRNGKIQDDDVVINFNFRVDRSRQISMALSESQFKGFFPVVTLKKGNYCVFGPYCAQAVKPFDFGDKALKNSLGEVVSSNKKTQLRISETEKFNHVTYYFSGQKKDEFHGESRILVPSKKCSSYAKIPEMSAREQCDALINAVKEGQFDLIVQNYANPDLVGHSGDFDATVKAIEVLDECLKKQIAVLQEQGYEICITADHGNADNMEMENGDANASHTKAPVPFLLISQQGIKIEKKEGTLQDIAPTVLSLMNIEIPLEMTGQNLIDRN